MSITIEYGLQRLLPHHLSDLLSSGLSERTIREWHCYSIEADQPWVMNQLGFGHLTPPALALPILVPGQEVGILSTVDALDMRLHDEEVPWAPLIHSPLRTAGSCSFVGIDS